MVSGIFTLLAMFEYTTVSFNKLIYNMNIMLLLKLIWGVLDHLYLWFTPYNSKECYLMKAQNPAAISVKP